MSPGIGRGLVTLSGYTVLFSQPVDILTSGGPIACFAFGLPTPLILEFFNRKHGWCPNPDLGQSN